jgi:hypothetical protein
MFKVKSLVVPLAVYGKVILYQLFPTAVIVAEDPDPLVVPMVPVDKLKLAQSAP